jgi:5-methylcytosine-specific restriction endonuclease McrA
MMSCIVLNADYTFLNTVNWQRAVCLVVKGKVEVLKYTDKVINNAEHTISMKIPAVIKLIKIIRSLYRNRVPFSKRNVMVRDGFVCAYCGDDRTLTIDHVLPVSRGGKSTFENCVAACKECNSTKGDRTPSEAKMYLKKQPYAPTISEFIRMRMEKLGIMDLLKELGVY